MESKLISIQEANRMLPLLRSIVKSIMDTWEVLITSRVELETLEKAQVKAEVIKSKKEELNVTIDRINNYIREVEELGCFVQEFKRGIVSFPSLFHGRKVFLCWIPDDQTVTHWHELDEMFANRQAIRGPYFLEAPVPKDTKGAYDCKC